MDVQLYYGWTTHPKYYAVPKDTRVETCENLSVTAKTSTANAMLSGQINFTLGAERRGWFFLKMSKCCLAAKYEVFCY